MFTAIKIISEQTPLFILVLFRIGGVFAMAPLMGAMAIPFKVKALLVLLISMIVFPLVPPTPFEPGSLMELGIAVGGELVIGLSMGFIVTMVFVGIQFGAEMISYQMGFALARMIDPMTDISTTVLSQFYTLLATTIYVLMNGHLILIRSIAHTFKTIPIMAGVKHEVVLESLVKLLSESFQLGIRIAGPALVALFLSSLAMGFISRTMPQLNILAAGFPIRITLSLVLLVASLGMTMLLFQEELIRAFNEIGMLFL